MDTTYSIGRLAKAAEVPVSTIRYYEQRDLLRPEHRTASRYRMYGPESLGRLRFIRAAQDTGFTLHDIAWLLKLRDGKADPCGDVRTIVEQRLAHVSERLKELRHVERVLRDTVEWCRKPRAKGCCQVIEKLDRQATSSGSLKRPRSRKKS